MTNQTVSRRHDWVVPAIVTVIVCCVLYYVNFAGIADKPPSPPPITSEAGVIGAVQAAQAGQTLTPFQPATDTPIPTDIPTLTHTPEPISDNTENIPVIQYVEVEKIVTVIVEVPVEVLITPDDTSTPRPTQTPQPTPDYRATQHALDTKAAQRAGNWETIAIWVTAFTCAILAGIVLVVIGRAMWDWFTSPKVQVEQTREEILTEMSPVDGVTMQQYRAILHYDAMYTNGIKTYSDTAIADKVFNYTGGDAIPKVRRVRQHNMEGDL